MGENGHTNHTFFDYLKKAKEELHALLETHPELAVLSARELEVFDYLLSDKTLSKILFSCQVLMISKAKNKKIKNTCLRYYSFFYS